MRYANIKEYDVANGPGVRVSLFVSGCRHHCKGCFNEEAWDFNYGNEYTKDTEDHIIELLKRDYISGITFLGGEPLEPENQEMISKLAKRVRKELPEKSIWCFTGYRFDNDVMKKMYKFLPYTKDIIENVDVIVDGKFMEDKYNPSLRFRGSENQRLIDVKSSLENDNVELLKLEYGI